MLSPSREEEDDDSHLCIKCNTTIIGLETYIKHRKERCGKKYDSVIKTPKTDIPILDPFELTYSLGADVFFQSLELQSSVKKTNLSRLSPPPVPKSNLDRKQTANAPSTSRDIPRISPLDNNLRGEDWIGGHSIRIGVNEDNQTKLINAVASISGTTKKDIPSTSYNIPTYNDYKGEEDSEEASDETDDEEDDEPHASGGKWKPPIDHTGGKWRPASPDHEDWEEEHTGGKWKPIMHSVERDDEYDDAPPPEHTKGKWVPGAQEQKTQIMEPTIHTKTSVQYWCGPCNRRLASKSIYDKHLRSNLHMKKVLPEHDLEYAGHINTPRILSHKRTSRPSHVLDDTIYQLQKKTIKLPPAKTDRPVKVKRKRKKIFTQCPGCSSRVRAHLMGKHLISHYHFRKATDVLSDTYQKLVLDNIGCIVKQSPYQCSPCKFYTNWQTNFMEHWLSPEHELATAGPDSRFWCSFCKFECDTSLGMYQHMSGSEHREVVAVINRSMPIVIRKKVIFRCGECKEKFRFNVEAKRHCKKTGHKVPLTATDLYQEIHACGICKERFKSSRNLAAHLKVKHKKKAYFCIVCSRSFMSSEEAKRHRETTEHRIKRKENQRAQGVPIKDLRKKCPYCVNLVLKNVLDLKDHINIFHPEMKKSCSKCGMTFALSQEVTRHVRSNGCRFQQTDLQDRSVLWNCSQCLFTTHSQAECFYHEVLHTQAVAKINHHRDSKKVIEKYSCPLCPRNFNKASLRHHLRQHTFERPCVCSVCRANFTRPGSLANHYRKEHGTPKHTKTKDNDEDLRCTKCNKIFANRTYLSRHTTTSNCQPPAAKTSVIRELKCPYDGCAFLAATSTQLFRHRKSHGEQAKLHECTQCSFKTNQISHLKRHMICHKGIKPYGCPHCNFTCGSLENLRKHVLRKGGHPDQFLYTCKDCFEHPYQTNLATELRQHLTSDHGDKYDRELAIEAAKNYLLV